MAQSEVSSIARHSGIYLIGGLLNRSASFILLPLYLNVLTPAEYGWLSVVLATMEILALVLGLGLGSAMVRLLVECKDEADTGVTIGSTLAFFLVPSGILLALIWPGSQVVASIVSSSQVPAELFALGFGAAIFTVLFEICLSVFRGLKLSWWYTILSTGKSVLFLGFNTLFLLGFDWGVAGILLGTIFSVFLLVLYAIFWFYRHYTLSVSKDVVRRLAQIGMPIVPGALMDAAFTAMDKLYLAALVDPATVGIYALAAKLAHLIRIGIAAPFAQIWTVRRLEVEAASGEEKNDPVFTNTFLGFISLFLLASLALSLFSPEVIWLIGKPAYYGAAEFVPFALAAIFLYVLKWNFEIGIFAAEKTIWISVVSGIILAMAAPAYSLIVPLYGVWGVAFAMVALSFLRTVLTAALAARVSSVLRTFAFWRATLVFVIAGTCYLIPRIYAGPFLPFEDLVIRLLAFVVFVSIVLVGLALHEGFYSGAKKLLRKGKSL